MATVRRELITPAHLDDVWAALRDVAALHTRLVPGFVVSTVMDGFTRIVTFANGVVVREPIVTVDDGSRRVVWTPEGGAASHYNGAVQAEPCIDGTRVVWIADVLPDELAAGIAAMMTAGMTAMQAALDSLAPHLLRAEELG